MDAWLGLESGVETRERNSKQVTAIARASNIPGKGVIRALTLRPPLYTGYTGDS